MRIRVRKGFIESQGAAEGAPGDVSHRVEPEADRNDEPGVANSIGIGNDAHVLGTKLADEQWKDALQPGGLRLRTMRTRSRPPTR
jgi:hypothetical protein